MRLILASARGLLGGWLVAVTMPLLFDPHVVAAWDAAGLGNRSRVALATLELLGAVLFAFDAQAATGFALLLVSFIAAATLHLHLHEIPWWLAAYAIVGGLLLRFTVGARPTAGPAQDGPARG
jgi:hypothetical protein